MGTAAFVISVLSAIMSLIALIYSRSQARSANLVADVEVSRERRDLQSIDTEHVNEGYASLNLRLVQSNWGKHYRIGLDNQGEADAQCLRVEPAHDNRASQVAAGKIAQIETLKAGDSFLFDVLVPQGEMGSLSLAVSWRDGVGAAERIIHLDLR